MKKEKIIYSLLLVIVLFNFMNCSDMNDLHQEYLDRGEKIYCSKVDTAIAYSGYKRQKVEFSYTSNRIVKGILYWDQRENSVEIDFPQPTEGPVDLIINNLPEGDHIYEIVTYDIYNNPSLVTEFTGKVYGDSYINSLVNKAIEKMETIYQEGNMPAVRITWREAENSYGIRLKYTTNEGKEVELFIPDEEEKTLIENPESGSEFSYSTYFKPDTLSIDTFQAAFKYAEFPEFNR